MKMLAHLVVPLCILVTCSFVEAIFAQRSYAKSSHKTVRALSLCQVHYALGEINVLLAPEGLRLECVKSGIVAVAAPPQWNVSLFNPVTKKFTRCSVEQCHSLGANFLTIYKHGNMAHIPFALPSRATVCGIAALKLESLDSFAKNLNNRYLRHEVHPSSASKATYVISSSLAIPKAEAFVMARLYGLREFDGIPLEFKFFRVKSLRKATVVLSTKSCEKKVVPITLFQCPSNFERVDSMETLFAESASGEGGIGLIIQEMDSSKEFPVNNKGH